LATIKKRKKKGWCSLSFCKGQEKSGFRKKPNVVLSAKKWKGEDEGKTGPRGRRRGGWESVWLEKKKGDTRSLKIARTVVGLGK